MCNSTRLRLQREHPDQRASPQRGLLWCDWSLGIRHVRRVPVPCRPPLPRAPPCKISSRYRLQGGERVMDAWLQVCWEGGRGGRGGRVTVRCLRAIKDTPVNPFAQMAIGPPNDAIVGTKGGGVGMELPAGRRVAAAARCGRLVQCWDQRPRGARPSVTCSRPL